MEELIRAGLDVARFNMSHGDQAGKIPIIAAGGILSGDDARAKLAAGATLVQLYTGLIYRGPKLIPEAIRATAAECSNR